MKIYAVGDIHGVGGDVVDTIEQSFNGKPDPNKYIIFLGDYIDRGGYEKETLEKLIAFKQKYPHNSFFLLGNHEYLMLDALKKNLYQECTGGIFTLVGKWWLYYNSIFPSREQRNFILFSFKKGGRKNTNIKNLHSKIH